MRGDRGAPVAAIVLAAGSSTRMGANKLLFTLDGEPLVRRAARHGVTAGLDPVIVVLGHEAELVRLALVGVACRCVVNEGHTAGVNSSLKRGLAALPSDADALVVMLADMPCVTSEMLAALVARYRAGTAPLVISEYGGVNAPPMLYHRDLFEELRVMEGEGCGRQVVKRHRQDADVVSWEAAALTDVDVPADFQRVRSLVSAGRT
jgi:molybdenum cofactor cytidylyltransferase